MSTQNIYDMADTWNEGATTFTGLKMNITDTASATASKLFDFQIGGTSKLHALKSGQVKSAHSSSSVPAFCLAGEETGWGFTSGTLRAVASGAIVFNGTNSLFQFVVGDIRMTTIPTSDPATVGRLWNNAGVLTVSAG